MFVFGLRRSAHRAPWLWLRAGKLLLAFAPNPVHVGCLNVGLEKLKIKSTKQHFINHPQPSGNPLKENKPRHFFLWMPKEMLEELQHLLRYHFCFFFQQPRPESLSFGKMKHPPYPSNSHCVAKWICSTNYFSFLLTLPAFPLQIFLKIGVSTIGICRCFHWAVSSTEDLILIKSCQILCLLLSLHLFAVKNSCCFFPTLITYKSIPT